MSKRKVVVPTVTWSPGESLVEATRRPLTLIPLVEPRSAICQSPDSERRSSAWYLDTLRSATTTSLSLARPILERHLAMLSERDDTRRERRRFGS